MPLNPSAGDRAARLEELSAAPAHMSSWDRRAFLGFLAASPISTGLPAWARQALEQPELQQGAQQGAPQGGQQGAQQPALIGRAGDALDVFDFEPVARTNIRAPHFAYIATGVDGEDSLRANREGFARLAIRARRMMDVSAIDMRTTIFGQPYDTPIYVCPTSSNRAFHEDAELAVSRAARAGNHLQMLSTVANTSIEDAIAARGAPIWFQFYPPRDWALAQKMARRVEAAGSPVLVLTADLTPGSNRITLERARRAAGQAGGQMGRGCAGCHEPGAMAAVSRKPMFDGMGPEALPYSNPAMNWDYVKRLRDTVKMRIVIKGLVTREDAELAVRHGVDGVIVSNHGGRADDGGRGAIDCLSEVVAGVNGKMPVMFDSGVRRGTDIVKAIALGASAVGIGRPYLWGLAAFGQGGVEKVFSLLRAELRLAMAHAGATTIKGITRTMVVPSGRS